MHRYRIQKVSYDRLEDRIDNRIEKLSYDLKVRYGESTSWHEGFPYIEIETKETIDSAFLKAIIAIAEVEEVECTEDAQGWTSLCMSDHSGNQTGWINKNHRLIFETLKSLGIEVRHEWDNNRPICHEYVFMSTAGFEVDRGQSDIIYTHKTLPLRVEYSYFCHGCGTRIYYKGANLIN